MTNSLDKINPELCKEWHPTKNDNLLPSAVSYGSQKKVWWLCKYGHEWQAQVKSRNAGRGCPYCSNNKVLSGYNDLATQFPVLCKEWNYEKNAISPNEILPGSHTKVWWICKNGHEWEATPNKRTSLNRGCPYCCHNTKVIVGVNDMETVYPEIAKEWDYEKNEGITPNKITANSNKPFWWKCKKGHSWKTTPNHRADGSNCPMCAKSRQTSFPEQAIFYYVSKYYPDAKNKYKELFDIKGMELDVYIPSMKIGIEYDGVAFHTKRTKERDIVKYEKCKTKGVKLIRVKEMIESEKVDDADIIILCESQNNLNKTIQELGTSLSRITDVDVIRDRNTILANYLNAIEENSIEKAKPLLAKEWNYEKNYPLVPTSFSTNSNYIVWWKCSKGHEWKSSIDTRNKGAKCPYCTNRYVLKGYNDLETRNPILASEWNYERNEFKPSEVLPGSGKKAWWRCSKCNYEWMAEISSRNKGAGCPKCARNRKKKGNLF